jgi:hypothetical protein
MRSHLPADDHVPHSLHRPISMRLTSALPLTLVSLIALTACGSSGSSSTTDRPAAQASGASAENGAANGEAPAITYTNSRFKYRVDAPGPMTETADGSAAYVGPTQRLEVAVLTAPAAADPHRRAVDDLGVLRSSKTAYKQVDPVAQVSLSGKNVQKLVFSWTDGVNTVTGKPNDLVSARYYIAKDRSTLAVVTYSIAANQYDPQGADDIASTFTWQ